MGTEVNISVHERLVGKGYVVKVTAEGREIKFPVDDCEEAVLLAESIKEGIEVGIPLDAILPEEACVPATEDAR